MRISGVKRGVLAVVAGLVSTIRVVMPQMTLRTFDQAPRNWLKRLAVLEISDRMAAPKRVDGRDNPRI
jgi:hypothetical protein